MKNKKVNESNQIMGKLVIYDLDKGANVMIYVAKWLKNLSDEIAKSAKKEAQCKFAKVPTYNKRFIARLYK